ncbi:PH domain-containing protein [Desulfosporosinus sp. FKA]|uniref:PH domain-containing protein n=1 Tax=Desulfosporosinus sp. FKA TaxID=1969834 RepID=UPI000B49F140|nr:PH domain-containing protein [Desulfosporosinus sp. FKA]
MYFSSKRDIWLGLLLWIPIIAVLVLTTWIPASNGQYDPTGTFIFIPIVAFIAWLWFGTGYRVTDNELKIKCGPIRKIIYLEEITKIESTRNPISSPALSLDRLEIKYGESKTVIISPQNKEGFINQIIEKCPTVTVDGNNVDISSKKRMSVRIRFGAIIAVLAIVGVGTFMYFSNKPASYTIQGGTLKISGEYGEVIKLSDIAGIAIKDQIPEIQLKTNGSGLGSMLKGYFKLKGIGQAKLFVDTQKPPFIFINVKSGLRIMNTEEPSETDQLYKKLLEAWKQNATPM